MKRKRKIRAITPLKVIQGHRDRTVSELSQLIVKILDTLRFRVTLWGLRDDVRYSSWAHWKPRRGLFISDNFYSLGVTAAGATGENR